jgi:hypothetical protein
MREDLRENLKYFVGNVTKHTSSSSSSSPLGALTPHHNRYENTEKFLKGSVLDDYSKYLQQKCDTICKLQLTPKYKVLYDNEIIKKYINDECGKCSIKLKTFNKAFDDALKVVYPSKLPSSPTTHSELPILLLESGTDIFNAISAPDIKKDLKAFENLDEEDWGREIAQTEIDLVALAELENKKRMARLAVMKKAAALSRRKHRGGQSKKSKKRKKKKKCKRKTNKKKLWKSVRVNVRKSKRRRKKHC